MPLGTTNAHRTIRRAPAWNSRVFSWCTWRTDTWVWVRHVRCIPRVFSGMFYWTGVNQAMLSIRWQCSWQVPRMLNRGEQTVFVFCFQGTLGKNKTWFDWFATYQLFSCWHLQLLLLPTWRHFLCKKRIQFSKIQLVSEQLQCQQVLTPLCGKIGAFL